MNFNAPLLQPIRILLFPFSLLYALGVRVRNLFYDKGWMSSSTFGIPLICVGNLAVGGTGKSTMVEYLIKQLQHRYRLAILSRGYKRKTKGYALAVASSTALEIGDEPMLFHSKFPEVAIAVGEERLVAIPQLLHDKPETQVIILDDAFQHRSIRPGFTILLTEFNNLYINDWYLPTGDLRDQPSRVKEANVVVVTKCPPDLQWVVASQVVNELQLDPGQKLLFSSIKYGDPYHLLSRAAWHLDMETEVLLVTGIANPRPLKQYLHASAGTYYEMLYADHHIFTIDDWREIVHRFNTIQASRKMILTTEKDAVRLVKFGKEMEQYPLYVIPIEMDWLFGAQDELLPAIQNFIDGFHGNEMSN